jgi:DNA polymerase IV (archaeal DinB-like DNA polymerase)
MPQRVIICVDMDAFYAQCEEKRDPSLKGKPVVVCVYSGRTDESGAVSTANYIARTLRVHSGMPIYQAKRILRNHPDAVFPGVDHRYYSEVSDRIMESLRVRSDLIEQMSVDEAYLDVTTRVEGDFELGQKLATEIKHTVLTQEGLTCSVGIAPNKLVAKMAADSKKPDGLTLIKPKEVVSFLAPLPVGKLYGVGVKTETRLRELGINTIAELAKYDPAKLSELFGRNQATYLHQAALGIDEEAVSSDYERKQIGRIVTLKENSRDPEKIQPVLENLAEDLHRSARSEGVRFRIVGVTAIMEDLSAHSKSKTLPVDTEKKEEIITISRELLPLLLKEIPNLTVRRIGLRLSGLSKISGQTPLTDYLSPAVEQE